MNASELKKLIQRVLTQPTAPYYETHVANEIRFFCNLEGVKVEEDTFGNLLVVLRPKGKSKPKGKLGFVAHMDHPGFEIVSVKGRRAVAQWRGGVWRSYFKNAQVVVHDNGPVKGKVLRTQPMGADKNRVETMELMLERPVSVGAFGQWDLVPFKMEGSLIHTRGADDLCSVGVQLALLKELLKVGFSSEVWLIFTRAEEIGFGGALAMLDAKILPKDLPLISLETSKTLPGATQGDGPVIRLGDRMTTFSPELLLFMENRARKLKEKNPAFRYQRRIMDGGMCEASAFLAYGHETAGIAFPLGNYHNMGEDAKGKPQLKAETVHLKDLLFGIDLMIDLCQNFAEFGTALPGLKKRLQDRNRPVVTLLKEKRI